MNVKQLFEKSQLNSKERQLKQAFELIFQLTNDQDHKHETQNFLSELEQSQQIELLLKHQMTALKAENGLLRKKSNYVDHLNNDVKLLAEQNLTLVNTIAQIQEHRRLLEAKNEHLRTEFSTKINLLNTSIKDHKAQSNTLELEKKKTDKELARLRQELTQTQIELAKKST